MSLSAARAKAFDVALVEKYGSRIPDLMETAGLAVAQAIDDVYMKKLAERPREEVVIFVTAGPGNNGGDGLVASRQLAIMGFRVVVWVPEAIKSELNRTNYDKLVAMKSSKISITHASSMKALSKIVTNECQILVDAVFGFSFQGSVRAPYGSLIMMMKLLQDMRGSEMITIAVDTPSGFPVDGGDLSVEELQLWGQKAQGIIPDVIVSLSAPKIISCKFLNIKPCRMVQGDVEEIDMEDPHDDGMIAVQPDYQHYLGLKSLPDGILEEFCLPPSSAYQWMEGKEIANITDVRFDHTNH